MSDSDKTLKLRIELDGYVMPGAEATKGLLDKVKADAGDVINETWKQGDEGAKKALESMEKYIDALAKARAGDSDYRSGLAQDNALLDAQVAARKAVLKAMEDNELAAATSEEQKKAIKQKYADIDQDLDKYKTEQRVKNNQDAIGRIEDDEKTAMSKKEGLEDQRNIAAREYGAADPRARAFDKQIADLQDQIAKDETELKKLQTENGNIGQISAVTDQGQVNKSIVSGDIGQSAKGIADLVLGGGKVETDQKTFLLEFADDLAHRLGALKPNQDFTSAKAAATFIENWMKSQTDPYAALFAQIHSAAVAAKEGQDQMAATWLAKFQTLESQINNGAMNFTQ